MPEPQTPATPSAAKNGASASAAAIEAARSAADVGSRQAKDTAEAIAAASEKTLENARAAARESSKATEVAADQGGAAAKAGAEVVQTQIESAQQAVRSSLEAGMRSFEGITQQWTRAFGAAAPTGDLTQPSTQGVQAVSQASSALAKGAQDASRAWFELTQKTMRTNLEAFGQLAGCRTVQDVVTLQSNLLRDNLQQAIESGEVIARASSDAFREATRAIQPQASQPQLNY